MVLGPVFDPFLTNVKQSMQQKGCTGHEQPLQRRRKSCCKVRTLFFNGNKVTATFSIMVWYEQSALQRLTRVKALSSLKAYPYDDEYFELQQIFFYTVFFPFLHSLFEAQMI